MNFREKERDQGKKKKRNSKDKCPIFVSRYLGNWTIVKPSSHHGVVTLTIAVRA